jgi:nucleoside-diphosphate-sugar epimerase
MKVLLLGVTGNVGSRLLPALIAHNHKVVAFVRSPSKLSAEVKSNLDSIVVGSATDSDAIKAAILNNSCDAVVNAAGLAAKTPFHSAGDFPAIFAAVVKAAKEAGRERGKAPIRCWLMSGFGILEAPRKPNLLVD